jgi:hypothetical protein
MIISRRGCVERVNPPLGRRRASTDRGLAGNPATLLLCVRLSFSDAHAAADGSGTMKGFDGGRCARPVSKPFMIIGQNAWMVRAADRPLADHPAAGSSFS